MPIWLTIIIGVAAAIIAGLIIGGILGFILAVVIAAALVAALNAFGPRGRAHRSEEHTSELQSHVNLVCRLLLEKKKKKTYTKIEIKTLIVNGRHCAHKQ